MKKLLVVLTVLAMATVANAALKISVGGVVDPPESSITLFPSDYVELDITGDGQDVNPTPYLLIIGPGSINGGSMLYDQGPPPSAYAVYLDAEAKRDEWDPTKTVGEYLADFAATWGVPGLADLSNAQIISDKPTPPPTTGTLVDDIMFHCEGYGDVLIRLVGWDDNGEMYNYDTMVIHQIPEPATMLLLGLGSLLLRRRK